MQVYLGNVSPAWVQVELYAEPRDGEAPVRYVMARAASLPGMLNGYHYAIAVATPRPAMDFTPRIIAWHPEARIPAEVNQIHWFPG